MNNLTHDFFTYDMGDFIIVVRRNRKYIKKSKKFLHILHGLSFTTDYGPKRIYWR